MVEEITWFQVQFVHLYSRTLFCGLVGFGFSTLSWRLGWLDLSPTLSFQVPNLSSNVKILFFFHFMVCANRVVFFSERNYWVWVCIGFGDLDILSLDLGGGVSGDADLGFSKWLETFQKNPGIWVILYSLIVFSVLVWFNCSITFSFYSQNVSLYYIGCGFR